MIWLPYPHDTKCMRIRNSSLTNAQAKWSAHKEYLTIIVDQQFEPLQTDLGVNKMTHNRIEPLVFKTHMLNCAKTRGNRRIIDCVNQI
jgi:hypothetical protein